MIPIIQNFGMIYGSAFKRFGISATQSTLIINVNQAFGMVLGMMNGPLLRKYGYRKMAVAGSLLYSSGVILTSFGSSLIHFIITYGMITCTYVLYLCFHYISCITVLKIWRISSWAFESFRKNNIWKVSTVPIFLDVFFSARHEYGDVLFFSRNKYVF